MNKPEILAPVGNYDMLTSAVEAGANAIYFGIKGLNMREGGAKNFSLEDMKKVSEICHKNNVKAYLAVNTIIYDNEIKKVKQILAKAKQAKIDAIICWDFSVIKEARKLGFEIHISTQASVSNYSAIEEYAKLGAKRIILAREVTLEELKELSLKVKKNKLDIKLEVFIHGAMCVAVSGRCFMSEFLYGKSANRGKCLQPCRRAYTIKDSETGKELELKSPYILSPKDLCTLNFLEKIIPYVDSLKIEGRGRSPEYVKYVVESYRKALDAISKKEYNSKLKKELLEKVKQVYNRGFSDGFYFGRPIKEFTDVSGSKATKTKVYAGVVKKYYKQIQVAEIKSEANEIKIGDTIFVMGKTTAPFTQKVESIQENKQNIEKIAKGLIAAIKLKKPVRKNDKVYLWE